MTNVFSTSELDSLAAFIDSWLSTEQEANPAIQAVEAGTDRGRSWYVRMAGEERDAFTIRFFLDQRTLGYETYFMPYPEENERELFEYLLRRTAKMYGGAFAIDHEGSIVIKGWLDNGNVSGPDLDRVLGSCYAWVEQFFKPAMRIGFASKFPG